MHSNIECLILLDCSYVSNRKMGSLAPYLVQYVEKTLQTTLVTDCSRSVGFKLVG